MTVHFQHPEYLLGEIACSFIISYSFALPVDVHRA